VVASFGGLEWIAHPAEVDGHSSPQELSDNARFFRFGVQCPVEDSFERLRIGRSDKIAAVVSTAIPRKAVRAAKGATGVRIQA